MLRLSMQPRNTRTTNRSDRLRISSAGCLAASFSSGGVTEPVNYRLVGNPYLFALRQSSGRATCQSELRFLLSAGRRSAHLRMASSVGQRDWPHDVRRYKYVFCNRRPSAKVQARIVRGLSATLPSPDYGRVARDPGTIPRAAANPFNSECLSESNTPHCGGVVGSAR